eukprot:148920-Rhodomonas_salina.4
MTDAARNDNRAVLACDSVLSAERSSRCQCTGASCLTASAARSNRLAARSASRATPTPWQQHTAQGQSPIAHPRRLSKECDAQVP